VFYVSIFWRFENQFMKGSGRPMVPAKVEIQPSTECYVKDSSWLRPLTCIKSRTRITAEAPGARVHCLST